VPQTQPVGSSLLVQVDYDSGPLAGPLHAIALVKVVKEIQPKN
jgi:hypothetical protein